MVTDITSSPTVVHVPTKPSVAYGHANTYAGVFIRFVLSLVCIVELFLSWLVYADPTFTSALYYDKKNKLLQIEAESRTVGPMMRSRLLWPL